MDDFVPAEVFPPGDYIKEELEERGLTQRDLADILGRAPHTINSIISGKTGITADTARGLAAAFDTSPELWLNLESTWQLHRKPPTAESAVAHRASLYGKAPIRDMIKREWLTSTSDPVILEQQVCDFFGIASLDIEPEYWPHAARKSTDYAGVEPELNAWLIRCRHVARAQPLPVKGPEKSLFESFMGDLRTLCSDPDNVRHVPDALSATGIRFVVVESLPKAKTDGVCFWLTEDEPAIALTLRMDRLDSFWFTLAHELAHVANRDGVDSMPTIDEDLAGGGDDRPAAEAAADRFAQDWLIPEAAVSDFVAERNGYYTRSQILKFAESVDVHPAIVVGRLQHEGEIPWSHFRNLIVNVRDRLLETAPSDGWGTPERRWSATP